MSLEAWGDEGDFGPDGYVTEEFHDESIAEKDAEIERLKGIAKRLHAALDACRPMSVAAQFLKYEALVVFEEMVKE